MTQEQVAFIGREAELNLIKDLISEWDTRRVLCIHAGGGIGKTRLLQEAHDRWRRRGTARLVVTELLTFDDRALHVPESLRHRLTEMLGRDTFDLYLRRRLDYRKMSRVGLSKHRLEQERLAVLETFRTCLVESLKGRRGLILLDTTDALEEGGNTWNYIASDLALQPCNMLLLIAGRNAKTMYKQLRPKMGEDIQLLELPPLDMKASHQYLLARQDQLHCVIDPELVQKLMLLAQGRPIFIDLAVDWLAHERPLPWLEERELEEIQKLPPAEMGLHRKEFERSLVHRIVELRTDLDRLLLALSHVYPLDAPLAANLLGLDKMEATDLLVETRSYVSIKQLPGGRITLHDEVRRLLNEVETEVDPEGLRRRSDDLKAASYFEAVSLDLKEELKRLEKKEQAARAKGQAQEEFDAALVHTELQREYWVAARQWLHHKLCVMPSEGIDVFKRLFDEATAAYQFSARGTFVEQVTQWFDKLQPPQQYEVSIRKASHLLDQAEYPAAREVLLELLNNGDLLPYQQVEILVQLGNVEVRLGNLVAGNEHFTVATQISEKHTMKKQQVRAELALGWGKRLVGQLQEAINHYRASYRRSIEVGDQLSEAWSLNNLAFANALLGHWKEALPLCEQAEELWTQLRNERGLGALYEVYGEIYTRAGEFERAHSYFRRALEIFEASQDLEWLCRIYAEQGITYRVAGDLKAAEQALRKADDLAVPQFKAQILHGLAHTHWLQGDIDGAFDLFNESYEESRRSGNTGYELNNLSDLAELAVAREEYGRLAEFEAKYTSYKEYWPRTDFHRAEGLFRVQLGKLALGARPDDATRAAAHFAAGFPLLAEYANLEAYKARTQLKRLDEHFKAQNTPAATVAHIGEHLYQTWESQELDVRHPEALSYIIRWMQQDGSDN